MGNKACFVATDTHRLAYAEQPLEQPVSQKHKCIVPRKAVHELIRLLSGEESVEVLLFDNCIRITNNLFTFTAKLLEGEFPNYQRAIPEKNQQTFSIDSALLKGALARATLLLDQKIQGLYLHLDKDTLKILASNQDNEKSEEVLNIDYAADALQVSYNATYLLDILGVIHTSQLRFCIADNRSAMVEEVDGDASVYLVMPIRD